MSRRFLKKLHTERCLATSAGISILFENGQEDKKRGEGGEQMQVRLLAIKLVAN